MHKVIKPATSPGEYRYGEELECDFPKKEEHWATAADERVRKADLDDLAGLPSLIAASPLGDALAEKAATRIFDNVVRLKNVGPRWGTPVCPAAGSRSTAALRTSSGANKCWKTVGARISMHIWVQSYGWKP